MRPLLILLFTLLLASCSTTPFIWKVGSIDDVPNIEKQYSKQLQELETGLRESKVRSLFPYAERECYPSGVCNITVFREDLIQVDTRLKDLNLLTGSLISLFALTCILSNDDCTQAAVAALNVGLASALETNRIQTTPTKSNILSLVQWINIEIVNGKVSQWAINEPLSQFQPKRYKNQLPKLEDALKTNN